MRKNNTTVIKHLFRYPVKSMIGEELMNVRIEDYGIEGDRLFMIIDENGQFQSQREIPGLVLFKASLNGSHLSIQFRPTGETRSIPLDISNPMIRSVKIWSRSHKAAWYNTPLNEWLSDLLEKKVQLVRVDSPDGYDRTTGVGHKKIKINFPDGYPLLLAGTASLNLLNSKLDSPVGWERFRPNIVVSCEQPHDEDTWEKLVNTELELRIVKPCPRCKIIATDQTSGQLLKEPTATLSTYRRFSNKINFGVYAFPVKKGLISKGNLLEIK